ncbi:FAD-dependent oxidoreductase [Ornithinibacter aureus]|uniref:FAD-dependent oxidoreductase n=1 Tax=Ornithinibacter aureus TaxID=622664 RepID=A0ABP8K8Z6_9MICO|nr:3-phenylpropionate/trans-cinnamate dioxygenase ferredoxin reductase subunit [Ornithinibacter aureus]
MGGGPAAGAAARALAAAGRHVVLLTEEDRSPYDRTVLSKDVLLHPGATVPEVWPAGAPWRERIEVRTRTRVASLDPDARRLVTASGEEIPFESVILATGAQPRRLALPGADGAGVHYLRDTTDAVGLASALGHASRLVIVGGGVIGLEVAAAATTRGVDVVVLEAADRVLARGVPAAVAGWLCDLHEARGVVVRTGVTPDAVLRSPDGVVTGVRLADGTVVPADAVVAGIGIVPRDELARSAGLAVDDGILIDPSGRTSHPHVFAAGDAVRTRHPGEAHGIRLESFTAAGRQGEVAAHTVLGQEDAFTDVPWWWSDQYDATVQAMGVAPGGAREEVLDVPGGLLVLSVVDDVLVAACGATHGPAVARVVRAAGPAIAAGARLDLAAARAAAGNLAALTSVLRAAARPH